MADLWADTDDDGTREYSDMSQMLYEYNLASTLTCGAVTSST